jgi:hypothetical protein
VQPGSITRVLLALVLIGGAAAHARTAWREAPGYREIFTPVAHRDAYTADTSASTLDAVLLELAGDATLVRAPGSWEPRPMSAVDAFGTAAPYNGWMVARLYGSRQPRVARGARMEGSRVVESWTLISPYPAADLRRLEPGTLRIVLKIAP